MGFGNGQFGPIGDLEEEDNGLSPETCYECKINGYPKKNGRKRRDANETQTIEVRDDNLVRCPKPLLKLVIQ